MTASQTETSRQTTVREFSAVGPCITLGEIIKQTASTVTFRERDDSIGRRGGYRLKCGLIHTAACRSCRDHAESQYPNGYEN